MTPEWSTTSARSRGRLTKAREKIGLTDAKVVGASGDDPKANKAMWPYNQIEPFLNYLRVEGGLAHNTIISYRRDLVRFAGHCSEVGLKRAQLVTPLLVQEYVRRLSHEGLSTSSVARHLASLRMFLRFHLLNQMMDNDICSVLDSPKTWRRLPGVLNRKLTLDLLSGVDPDSPLRLRDEALLELLYATGIRASEAAGLHLKSIDFQVGFLQCIGKGNKERIVPVHGKALQKVKDYIEQLRGELLGEKQCDTLFLSRTGRSLSRIEIWRIVRKAALRAGMVGKVSPHTLRHCFGSHLLQGGADLRSVQEMLGHADVTTTQIYTQVDQQHLRNIHKKYHPRA